MLVLGTVSACGGGTSPAPLASSAAAPSAAVSAAASAPAASTAGSSQASAGACAVAPAGAAATVNVSIKGFKFSPQPVEAKVGDVVAWKNEDSAPHSATMDDGSCDTDTISTGSSAMLVFTAPGTYTYHCKVHPSQMKDYTVEVK
jgi:plastocyanin